MSYGLSIDNPAGKLVISSERGGASYLGAPTLVSAPTVTTSGNVSDQVPYVYRVRMPDTTAIPVATLELSTLRIGVITGVARDAADATNRDWLIYVLSIRIADAGATNPIALAPTIHVFSTGATGTGTIGLQLFDASGALTADLRSRPLWINTVFDIPARNGTLMQSGTATGDWTAYNAGESYARDTSVAKIAIVGASPGLVQEDFDNGDVGNKWVFGWTMNAGNAITRRIWVGNERNDLFVPNQTGLIVNHTRAVIITTAGLP